MRDAPGADGGAPCWFPGVLGTHPDSAGWAVAATVPAGPLTVWIMRQEQPRTGTVHRS